MTIAAFPRAWFITGVDSGVGRVVAHAALSHGHVVAGTVRDAADAELFSERVPGRSHGLVADVRREDQVRVAVDQAIASMGRIDVVVNSAGYALLGAVEELSDAEVRAQFDANVFGPWNVLRAVLPHLRARRSGHVIQMSSIAGFAASGGGGAEAASMFALEGMSEALAFELGPLGVLVTVVEAGAFGAASTAAAARVAHRSIDDYAHGAASRRARLAELDGHPTGDPTRLGAALVALIDMKEPPVRLVLGDDALHRARTKLAWTRHELDAHEALSRATAFEG
jgi:NAD(P)-dependent dehydrogenase (short-subunit alcohol dehydrogenase family)